MSHIVGAIIAVAYVVVIGSIIRWMLAVPRAGDVEQHARRVTREASRFARIVVPVQGDFLSDRLVALASQMAKFRGATMDVLYVVEVPYTLPLSAEMRDQEQSAEVAFQKAERIAARNDVKINKQIERARAAGPAIVQYAQQHSADLLLIGDVPKANRKGTKFARSVEYVFENARCEVIIDRPEME